MAHTTLHRHIERQISRSRRRRRARAPTSARPAIDRIRSGVITRTTSLAVSEWLSHDGRIPVVCFRTQPGSDTARSGRSGRASVNQRTGRPASNVVRTRLRGAFSVKIDNCSSINRIRGYRGSLTWQSSDPGLSCICSILNLTR
mgnify:CR=1 FL=1